MCSTQEGVGEGGEKEREKSNKWSKELGVRPNKSSRGTGVYALVRDGTLKNKNKVKKKESNLIQSEAGEGKVGKPT